LIFYLRCSVKKERSNERVLLNSHARRKRHCVPPTFGNIGIKMENPNRGDHTRTSLSKLLLPIVTNV